MSAAGNTFSSNKKSVINLESFKHDVFNQFLFMAKTGEDIDLILNILKA